MSPARPFVVPLAAVLLAGCNFAPKYTRPSPPAPTPAAWKELTPADFASTDGWKQAQPRDDVIRGSWWEMFDDPLLDELERQVDAANQTLAQSYATHRAAEAVVAQYRSQLYPTVTLSPNATVSGPSGSSRPATGSTGSTGSTQYLGGGGGGGASQYYQVPLDASWQVDLWGSVRNQVAAYGDEAQATAADLENTRLSLHGQLAVYYFELRGQDAQKQLLDQAVVAYRKSLELTQVKHQYGTASDYEVAQAQTQLEQTIAQDIDLGISRAQYEHAIAVLVGQAASSFSIPVSPLRANPPAVPLGVPSRLLERRPDIAAGERRVAEYNAQIGVAKAAFFPTITLSAEFGFASSALSTLFSLPNRIWAFGASLAQTLFDGGKRQAQVEQALASFDYYVAGYRQTVLTAFQQVEDYLAAVRILSQERRQQDDAVASAQRALDLELDRYKFGVDPYLNVITAQTTLLSNQRTALTLRMQQMTATVQLIEALGGGWNASRLASGNQDVKVRTSSQPLKPAITNATR
jgi:NodT family efflux transporter outer membrane factor (OMF) lipoprotein